MQIYTNKKRAVRLWLWRKLQPCNAMVTLLSESMERKLTTSERRALRLHLFVCAWCASYLKQLKFLRRVLQLKGSSSISVSSDSSLSSVARERIISALNRSEHA